MTQNFAVLGRDLFGNPLEPAGVSPVAKRFIVPPFSVLSARDGDWQDRKRAWLSLGVEAETGRLCEGTNAWNDLSTNPRAAESTQKIAAVGDGATVFDPVLCELAYRWFSPVGGQVVDPFAGGSVRGVVASCLGRSYWGDAPKRPGFRQGRLAQGGRGRRRAVGGFAPWDT